MSLKGANPAVPCVGARVDSLGQNLLFHPSRPRLSPWSLWSPLRGRHLRFLRFVGDGDEVLR